MEAPVTTTIFPVSSITRFYSSVTCEVKLGYNLGQRGDLAKAHPALATGDFLDALLPLFPLDVVLFPGAALPLHIFEPRYKEMIGECLAQHRTFGVVRAVEQGLAEIGCTAEIITVVKEYPDGRLDLVSEGRQRFELLRVNQERSFLQAEVLMIDDEPGAPPQADTSRAVQLHSELLAIAGATQDLSAAGPALLVLSACRLRASRSGFQTKAARAALRAGAPEFAHQLFGNHHPQPPPRRQRSRKGRRQWPCALTPAAGFGLRASRTRKPKG